MSDSLQPHGLQSTRLLHPWGFPSKYGSGVLLPSPTNSDTYYYQFNLTQNICYKCCHEVYLRTTYYFENLLWANLLIYVCVIYVYMYICIYITHTYIYILYIIRCIWNITFFLQPFHNSSCASHYALTFTKLHKWFTFFMSLQNFEFCFHLYYSRMTHCFS